MKNIDIQLFRVIKYLDKLWREESINDLYEANLNNDKLVLLYAENQKNSISVKTPYGKTQKFSIENTIIFGSLKCTTSMNQLGANAYKTGTPLLTYKETVKIPSLGMIDIC